ncbi:MAG TPA: hypothetical protein VNQ53_06530 [Nocardioides sp.]|nr:hypothetical protein [Nocardioides sp.]
MAVFRRGSESTEAVYARVLDGEHLWLAVRGDGPLLLRRRGAADLRIPTAPQTDAEGPLLTARFALAEALADVNGAKLELQLYAGSGRRAAAVTYAAAEPAGPGLAEPTTRDRRWQFRVTEVEGEVVVRRTRLPATIAVLGFTSNDGQVGVQVNTSASHAALVSHGHRIASLPIAGGSISLADLPPLAAGGSVTFRVGAADVVRAGNALDRPMAGVALPPLPDPEITLRWTTDGLLALRREDQQ